MRTLFVAPRLPVPRDTGPKNRTWHLLQGVAQASTCTLVAFGGEEEAATAQLPSGLADVVVLPRPLRGRAADLGRLGLGVPLGLPVDAMRYSSPQMALTVGRLSRRAELVHFDHVHMAQYADLVQAAATVFDANAALHPMAEWRAGRQDSAVVRSLLEREARRLRAFEGQRVRRMDLVTACGDDDVRLLLDAAGGRGRVECLPSGVDLDAFGQDGPAAASGHVVLTGSMGWEPNADAAVWMAREILPELRKRLPGCQVFVVGRRPAPEVRALGAVPGVVVTGTVPDVRPYLRRARCLLVPARVGGGTRIKILEAFAARVPVVSTPLGAEGIEAIPGRDLLIGQTPVELADQIARLQDEPGLAPRLTASGRALVEQKYGWATLQKRLAALHQEALREHRGRRLSAPV